MTREEIEKAAKKKQLQWSMYGPTIGEVEEFTLDMVQRHNEELQQEFNSQWVIDIIKAIKP